MKTLTPPAWYLHLQGDDVGVKVRDMVQPSFETIREQAGPLRSWVSKIEDESLVVS